MKSFVRKGGALLGLRRHREAVRLIVLAWVHLDALSNITSYHDLPELPTKSHARFWCTAAVQVLCFEEGLQVDPFCWDLKAGLEKASQGVFEDLLTGACTQFAEPFTAACSRSSRRP